MANPVGIYRVKQLPATQEPGAIYFVKADGENASKQYVTDNEGNSFQVVSESVPSNLDLGTF